MHLLLALAALLSAPAAPAGRVQLDQPRAYEVWDGRVAGTAPPGTVVRLAALGHVWLVPAGTAGRLDAVLGNIPTGDVALTVAGSGSTPVYGVPSASLRPLPTAAVDASLSGQVASLAKLATPHVSLYARSWQGRIAAYNAGAEFEAASTLKLPIMLLSLSHHTGEAAGSDIWDAMERITRYSDNAAANELLEHEAGSDEAGAAEMVELMQQLGLRHTYMAGGYVVDSGGGSDVFGVVDPPPAAYKHTTAADMGRLAGMVLAAASGSGPLIRHGVDRHEARELLYLMLHAKDPGLVPAGAGNLPVAHKIGWLDDTDNDVAIVFGHRGPTVIAVYTNGLEDGTAQVFGAAASRLLLASL
ncbi:MAG TPA: serine hydrolase [Gaiellales bacterium]|nr:serine hydrolase [Gaiellales bacterium]